LFQRKNELKELFEAISKISGKIGSGCGRIRILSNPGPYGQWIYFGIKFDNTTSTKLSQRNFMVSNDTVAQMTNAGNSQKSRD
jgi:hypothetical protein